VAALIDTNLLVYRFDPRDRRKQRVATTVLRERLIDGSARLPHQAIVAAVTRPLGRAAPLLSAQEAHREAEELLAQFDVLYPNAAVLRLALRGAAAYQLSWFDAHLWAYAEHFGLSDLLPRTSSTIASTERSASSTRSCEATTGGIVARMLPA
jgi:predicted nucleic acid-binding protein